MRHLLLPQELAGTESVLAFLAEQISYHTHLNLMDQYHPCYRADEYPPMDRPLSPKEYDPALGLAQRYGIHRLDRR